MPTVLRRKTEADTGLAIGQLRGDTTQASDAAFGVGLGEALQSAAVTVDGVLEKERLIADSAAHTESTSELSTKENDLMHGENGAMNAIGKNVLGRNEETLIEFDDFVREKIETLPNRRQQDAYRRDSAGRRATMEKSLSKHQASELQKLDLSTTNAMVDSSINRAGLNYGEPEIILSEVERIEKTLDDFGARNGQSDVTIQTLKDKALSSLHVSVMNQMTSKGDDLLARDYFDTVKGELSADDTAKIEKTLRQSSVQGESQRIVDKILADGAEDFGEAKRLIKEATDDPTVRAMAEDRARQEFNDQNTVETRQRDDAFLSIIDSQKEGQPGRPQDWALLTDSQHAAAITFDRNLKLGIDPVTDRTLLGQLWVMPLKELSEITPAQFTERYQNELSRADFTRAQNYWASAVQSKDAGKRTSAFTKDSAWKSRLETQLVRSGFIDETSADRTGKHDIIMFEAEAKVHDQIIAFEADGKTATPTVIDEFINGVLRQSVMEREPIFDTPTPVISIPTLSDSEKEDLFIPLGQLNSLQISNAISVIRSNNPSARNLTDKEILDKAGDRIERAAYMELIEKRPDEEVATVLQGTDF